MISENLQRVVKLANQHPVLRSSQVSAAGIPRQYLNIACREGLLERVDRGLYRVPGTMMSEHQSLLDVGLRIPDGVICLLSALRFHELTTQNPFEVWIAVGEKYVPRVEVVAVRFAHFSGPSLTQGVDTHKIDGVNLKIYNPAKTVADCFKFRHKIGVDIAIESLRDVLRLRKASVDELIQYARICRVERVMTPYLEATL